MLTITLLLLVCIILLSIFLVLIKIQKKIWQKIDVIYNQIYLLMVCRYYTLDYGKKLLNEEMLDYLENIILENNLNKRIIHMYKIKNFLKEFLNNINIINQLNSYETYYMSLTKIKNLVILSVIAIVIVTLDLIYLNLKY